jgi:hypothetical protein
MPFFLNDVCKFRLAQRTFPSKMIPQNGTLVRPQINEQCHGFISNFNKHHHPDFVPTTYDFAQERYWGEFS